MRLEIVWLSVEHRLIVMDSYLRAIQAEHGTGGASKCCDALAVAAEGLLKGGRGVIERFHLQQRVPHEDRGVPAAAALGDRLLIQADRCRPVALVARRRD